VTFSICADIHPTEDLKFIEKLLSYKFLIYKFKKSHNEMTHMHHFIVRFPLSVYAIHQ